MTVFEFKLENLKELDNGKAAVAFNQAIKRAVDDIEDRPGTKKPRSVALQIALVPTVDPKGDLYDVKVQVKVVESVPKRESQVYSMAPRKGGMLVFNELSLEDSHQKTFNTDD